MDECVLGELFVRKRMLQSQDVERALSAQVSYGGRIGTNLVELGLLTLDQVAQGLSLQHGVPMATADAFEEVSSAVLGSVPREVCARFSVIPLKVVGGTLHVAMMDPQHLTLASQLGNEVGMMVQPYAAPQLRLLYYLERHYHVRRPERYLRIPVPDRLVEGDRRSYLQPTVGSYALGRAGPLSKSSTTGPSMPVARPGSGQLTGPALPRIQLSAVGPSGSRSEEGSGSTPLTELQPGRPSDDSPSDSSPELVMLDDRGESPPPAAPAPRVPPGRDSDPELDFEVHVEELGSQEPAATPDVRRARTGMLGLEEALSRIDRADGRQALLKQLIHPVLPETTLNLLTLVRGDVAIALGAWGTDLAPASVRALVLPLGLDSLLRRAFEERAVVRAPALGCRLQKMIAVYFRSEQPCEACITPISFEGKVVNIVIAHAGRPFADSAAGEMEQLSSRASAAYQRLVETLRQQG